MSSVDKRNTGTSRASAATGAAATTRTAGSSSASTAGSRPAGPGAIGPRNSNGTAATAPSLGPYTHSSAPRASPAPAARASPHDAARRSSGASGNGSPAQPCPSRSPAGLHVHQPDARASHGSAPAAPKPLASSFTNVPQPQLAARTRVAQDILGDSGPESRDYETHGSPTTGSTATTTSTAVAAPAVVAPDGPAPTEQDELCELAAAGIIVACQLDGSGVCDVSMRGITRLPSALSKFFRAEGSLVRELQLQGNRLAAACLPPLHLLPGLTALDLSSNLLEMGETEAVYCEGGRKSAMGQGGTRPSGRNQFTVFRGMQTRLAEQIQRQGPGHTS